MSSLISERLRFTTFSYLSVSFFLAAFFATGVEAQTVSETAATENPPAQREAGEEELPVREPASVKVLDRITVAASKEEALETPGSANVITEEELDDKLLGVDDIHRTLRGVPGVNIQEEEGYGLRPNIGFRGVPNERSSKITLMEDGILIAPAPYAAPSAYYFPPVGRMEAIEILKGAGQIKYGPYTTGGSLNLLSTSIPEEMSARAKVGVGNDNFRKVYANAGTSWKYGGLLFETYQLETDGFKDLDGGGDTGVDLEDYQIKARLNTNPDKVSYQQLEYKFGIYDQLSNSSYLGLTDEDFGDTPFRRYAASQNDQIDVDHIQHHLVHFARFNAHLDLTTNFYRNETQRNWTKLEQVSGSSIASILANPNEFSQELDYIRGATSPEGVLAIRGNQRDYESMGIQSVLGAEFELAGTEHELEVGARYHVDEEDRFQRDDDFTMINGSLALAEQGAPGSQSNRIGSANAWAFYAQDTISMGSLALIPGLRYESIDYTREDFGKEDPDRTGADLERNDSDIDQLIPGISVRYEIAPELFTFAGLHRGFSPPGPSSRDEVREEESLNYELGSSYSSGSFASKLVLFYTDYENLLGADTLSAGGSGTGNLFNGGEVDVLGLEFSAEYDLLESLDSEVGLPAKLTYTYTDADFESDFDSDFFGEVRDGDPVPYIPQNQAYASIGIEQESYGIYLEGSYVDSMPTAGGELSSTDKTDSAVIFDVVARKHLSDRVGIFASVENVFDREYVVARRPAGARPGLPLTAVVGFDVEL